MLLWGQERLAGCHSWSLVTNRVSLPCSPHACVGTTGAQERRLGVRAILGVGAKRCVLEPGSRSRRIHMQIRQLGFQSSMRSHEPEKETSLRFLELNKYLLSAAFGVAPSSVQSTRHTPL